MAEELWSYNEEKSRSLMNVKINEYKYLLYQVHFK